MCQDCERNSEQRLKMESLKTLDYRVNYSRVMVLLSASVSVWVKLSSSSSNVWSCLRGTGKYP